MAATRVTLRQWFDRLDNPVPLDMVPALTGRTPAAVQAAVRAGRLRVHTFKSSATQIRVVLFADLRKLQPPSPPEPVILHSGLVKALARWLS
jgi:hypothetical protein